MTLDEIELLAVSMANAYRGDTDEDHEDVHRLAEFICAAMPVVRAAVLWNEFANNHPYGPRGDSDLDNAISTMRATLSGEKVGG
jgi:hypothetical protein